MYELLFGYNWETGENEPLIIAGVSSSDLPCFYLFGLIDSMLFYGLEMLCGGYFWVLFLVGSIICYVMYVRHAKKMPFLEWMKHQVDGTVEVLWRVEDCHKQTPRYKWTIQCYHTESRGSGDNRSTVRVNTHYWEQHGYFKWDDQSDKFVPDQGAKLTQFRTYLKVENLKDIGYDSAFDVWKKGNIRDTNYDITNTQYLERDGEDFLWIWVKGTKPWWIDVKYFLICLYCGFASCYRTATVAFFKTSKIEYKKIAHSFHTDNGPTGKPMYIADLVSMP